MQKGNQINSEAVLTIIREFNAPRALVFKAFSEAERLAEWWGPVGYKLSVVSLAFKPNGIFHYKMESNERVMWGRFVYGQIKKPELIEFTLSFSDETGGITRAPFFNPWPLEIFNVITFDEKNGKTTITSKSYPINATEEEIASYKKNKSSFNQGLRATFDQLQLHLSK